MATKGITQDLMDEKIDQVSKDEPKASPLTPLKQALGASVSLKGNSHPSIDCPGAPTRKSFRSLSSGLLDTPSGISNFMERIKVSYHSSSDATDTSVGAKPVDPFQTPSHPQANIDKKSRKRSFSPPSEARNPRHPRRVRRSYSSSGADLAMTPISNAKNEQSKAKTFITPSPDAKNFKVKHNSRTSEFSPPSPTYRAVDDSRLEDVEFTEP